MAFFKKYIVFVSLLSTFGIWAMDEEKSPAEVREKTNVYWAGVKAASGFTVLKSDAKKYEVTLGLYIANVLKKSINFQENFGFPALRDGMCPCKIQDALNIVARYARLLSVQRRFMIGEELASRVDYPRGIWVYDCFVDNLKKNNISQLPLFWVYCAEYIFCVNENESCSSAFYNKLAHIYRELIAYKAHLYLYCSQKKFKIDPNCQKCVDSNDTLKAPGMSDKIFLFSDNFISILKRSGGCDQSFDSMQRRILLHVEALKNNSENFIADLNITGNRIEIIQDIQVFMVILNRLELFFEHTRGNNTIPIRCDLIAKLCIQMEEILKKNGYNGARYPSSSFAQYIWYIVETLKRGVDRPEVLTDQDKSVFGSLYYHARACLEKIKSDILLEMRSAMKLSYVLGSFCADHLTFAREILEKFPPTIFGIDLSPISTMPPKNCLFEPIEKAIDRIGELRGSPSKSPLSKSPSTRSPLGKKLFGRGSPSSSSSKSPAARTTPSVSDEGDNDNPVGEEDFIGDYIKFYGLDTSTRSTPDSSRGSIQQDTPSPESLMVNVFDLVPDYRVQRWYDDAQQALIETGCTLRDHERYLATPQERNDMIRAHCGALILKDFVRDYAFEKRSGTARTFVVPYTLLSMDRRLIQRGTLEYAARDGRLYHCFANRRRMEDVEVLFHTDARVHFGQIPAAAQDRPVILDDTREYRTIVDSRHDCIWVVFKQK